MADGLFRSRRRAGRIGRARKDGNEIPVHHPSLLTMRIKDQRGQNSPSLLLPRQKPPMTLSPFEDPDSAALSLLSAPSEWAEERGKSHDPQLQLSRTSRHRAITTLSSHPNLASCFQPPKCSALRLAWPGTSIPMLLSSIQPSVVAPEPGRNSFRNPSGVPFAIGSIAIAVDTATHIACNFCIENLC